MEQRKVDLDALEAALMELRLDEQKALWAKLEMKRQEIRWDLIPALIAELRQLRARTTPEVIGEKHRDGKIWLVCVPDYDGWQEAKWNVLEAEWRTVYGSPLLDTPAHALPLPPALEAKP